ncbi:tRNA (adenosine(37)-N6)-threonylcarbamoyltransferase complex transferase subunit TsaD [Collinsella sp. AGMB00827]|uniref:tRNA N6-adenosine threonylcarbamoyltransferase n=1 Tax=Collinsella ureilytica TaxID=2869515 RepID=A0ABS7MJJ3_9ACTN|nr:tRNA (adenosine(37)-N6)-threonylcarbamoyltransferase complex transferase subunit TsaD [Collinsella urealyticum]MBY4797256.1 tRNA (adenosine(37)-N6)-threonylcarbamoyltransferase complex transferase subunit TsaD [Collinsella urealyticum]
MDQDRIARVVAIDTATDMLCCSVAQIERTEPEPLMLAVGDHACRRRANVELIHTLEDVLVQANCTFDDIDGILVGRGPGSFTGVRIGISSAKGLAVGANLPLLGVSTLAATAWSAWSSGVRGLVGVAADAMRGELYPALFRLDDTGVQRLFERESVMKAAQAVEAWAALSEAHELLITGDGLLRHQSLFEQAGFAEQFLETDLWWPTGEGLVCTFLADQGLDALSSGVNDPAAVLPVYTRLSDAEENERRRLGQPMGEVPGATGVAEELAGRHLQVRPMAASDAEAAACLDQAAFADASHSSWTAPQFLSELAEHANSPRSWWVAHDDGELIGLAGGMVVEAELEILDVVVRLSHRRQGVARRLLAQVSYDAQMLGCTTASLEVDANNTDATALYASLGFKEVGRRPNYYGQASDALIMRASLPLRLPVNSELPEPTATQMRPWPRRRPKRSCEEAAELSRRRLTLAIESSCDETAVAIIDVDGKLLANQVSTQIDFHARFGGVVPEIASRKHVEVMVGVVDAALEEATAALGLDGGVLEPSELAAVSVTQGPGLVGALVVGVAFAKGLSLAAKIPLIVVNHLEGHLFANLLTEPDLKPPFIFTLVSGGHTMLVHVRAWGDYEVLGETLDDAVGETFDKVAKALGLGYPGGPIISRLAETGNPRAIDFPRAMMHSHDFRFSLSGLKTAVVTYIEQEVAAGRTLNLHDLAASFEAAVFDVQFKKAWEAIKLTGVQDYCLGGGVAANPHLRQMLTEKLGRRGIRVILPPQGACTDNAAMIAEVARRKLERGEFASLDVDADPNMTL